MKNEQEKIIHFELNNLQGVSVTHDYNISNTSPVHFHASYTLGIIELGERVFNYRGISTVLNPDDIFIIQPFELHDCKSAIHSYHSYKILSFNLDSPCYFPDLLIDLPELRNKVKEFHTLAEYERTSSSSQLKNLYDEIVHLLLSFSYEINNVNPDPEATSKLYTAKQFIEKNCLRNISLEEMSDIACLSKFHFNRLFHKSYGLSPYAYYLVCKSKKLQKVLLNQKSEIGASYENGFFDQSHFIKLFKKYVGVAPGKYLRDNNPLAI